MPFTQQKHYTVGYHDAEEHHHEICEYADDAYSAIEHSKEDVPYLKAHPSFIDYCNFVPTQVDKYFYLRSCGIPFGC